MKNQARPGNRKEETRLLGEESDRRALEGDLNLSLACVYCKPFYALFA